MSRGPGARIVFAGVLLALVASAVEGGGAPATDAYTWELPEGFPRPLVPADNPMAAEKVELGRHLFYDRRLSINGTQACASCHQQALAFSDGKARAVGATGETHPRSAMGLTNVAYNASFTWTAPGLSSLERQLAMPLFARRPVELGLSGATHRVERELAADAALAGRFAHAFPGDPRPVRIANVGRAIASFERTLISGGSPYDRLLFRGEREALSPEAKRGMELFFSPRLGCSRCHSGFNLSGPVVFGGQERAEPAFHNTNLRGGEASERRNGDRFRAPTLRNVAVTAPYMHDGSLGTLAEVVDHYAAGGRGRPPHPGRSPLVAGFTATAAERQAVVRFLEALTDSGFLVDPRFAPPS